MTNIHQQSKPTSMPTLRQLHCFQQAAEHSTFTQAAQSLAMSQPAFSSAIAELEKNLGTVLFDRSMRRVQLTCAGKSVRTQVSWMISNFEQGITHIQQQLQSRNHAIAIHCTPSALPWITPRMAEFLHCHPEARFTLDDVHSDSLSTSITQGTVDIAVGLGCGTQPDIQSCVIASDEIVAVLSKHHPLAKRAKLQWNDLKDQALVMLQRGHSHGLIAPVLQERGLGKPQKLLAIESLHAMVHSNLKIGLISSLNKQKHLGPELCYLPLVQPLLTSKISLMRKARRNNTPILVQRFWDALCKTL